MDESSIRGTHPVMRAIVAVAERIAATDVHALIIGERGTGKELLARHIHAIGSGPQAAFVRLDCQDVVSRTVAIELCNAVIRDLDAGGPLQGALDRARGGTLFFDHLDVFDAVLQGRLLAMALEAASRAGIRVLAASDVDGAGGRMPAAELGMVEIPVPALRQRRSDIPVLVRYFLDLYATRHGAGAQRVDTAAMVALWQYDWPGNVRELESVIERIVVLGRGDAIRCSDLPPHIVTTGRYGFCDPIRPLAHSA